MALDGIYLYSLIQELKNSIINCKIDKINQPEKDEIILTIRGKERKKLLISSSSNYPRIHFTTISKNNPLQAPTFCMVLRKYLTAGKIVDIYQHSTDRILFMDIENLDELGFQSIYTLVVEIMGRHSNITLVRKRDNKIMESIKHITANKNTFRVLYPGVNYVLPPKSLKPAPFNLSIEDLAKVLKPEDIDNPIKFDEKFFSNILTGVSKPLSKELYKRYLDKHSNEISKSTLYSFINEEFTNLLNNKEHIIFIKDNKFLDFYFHDLKTINYTDKKIFNSHSELLDNFYQGKDKQNRLHAKSVDLLKLVNTNIDRCLKKIKILENTLSECALKDDFKFKGELLTAYVYAFKKGDRSVSILNYYSDKEEYIDIPLDENKTPSENIQYFFKKYNKLKTAEKSALKQLEINNEELNYLYSVLNSINSADNYDDIDEIKAELISSNYIKFRKSKGKNKSKASKPLHFISSDGIDIYVGKNNIQNDYLTLKFADKGDTWLHTKNIPGSHVIIKSRNISDETLMEAATLAAFYSKGQKSTKVPVDYTDVKNVKKPSGAKPGMVIYSTNKTCYVDPPENITLEKK